MATAGGDQETIIEKCIANGDVRPSTPSKRGGSPKNDGSCVMCQNYEIQLQQVQMNEDELRNQLAKSQEHMKGFKDDLHKERQSRTELEEKFKEEAKAAEFQLHELLDSMENREHDLSQIKALYNEVESRTSSKVSELVNNNEILCKKLASLHRENDALLGRNIAKSSELDQENINLPQDATEIQFYLLKLQQELITTLVAKERLEETHRSELMFLKDSYNGELQSKDILIEELTIENDTIRAELDGLRTSEKKHSSKLREQGELLESCQTKMATLIPETDRVTTDLKCQVAELTSEKAKLREELTSLNRKVHSLQVELDNSEAVQRDFVKLSQSLQIQLEKIRQADSEVRWQHEDDVNECNNCKKRLNARKEKSHCSHCGHIFCIECNSKIIYGGPKNRPFKVCLVCHTLLDHQTAPYFSNVNNFNNDAPSPN